MEDSSIARQNPCLIVGCSPVVAEDLTEILAESGFLNVLILNTLDAATGHDPALVIVAGAHAELLAEPSVKAWQADGTPVVIVNGHAGSAYSPPGIYGLEQPFRSEMVEAILDRIKSKSR